MNLIVLPWLPDSPGRKTKVPKRRFEPPEVNVAAMDQRTIFTWGYRKQTQDTLLAIMKARRGLLVDVRFMPFGRSKFAQYRLKASLGDRYLWAEGYGNRNWQKDSMADILLADSEHAFRLIVWYLSTSAVGLNPILMCVEPRGIECHRLDAARHLAAQTGWPIINLSQDGRVDSGTETSRSSAPCSPSPYR